MKPFRPFLSIAILAACMCANAQGQAGNLNKPVSLPPPTSYILSQAEQAGKADGKNVLVIFHASWCGWCKQLDKFMNDPAYKQVFEDNFETVKLTVLETEEHKMDENAGGLEEMDLLGGRDAGLPLFAILDPDGKVLATSIRPVEGKDKGENTGFPAAPEEIDHFVSMMQKGAPKLTPDELTAMKKYLTDTEAARKAAADAKKAASGNGGAGGNSGSAGGGTAGGGSSS
jgi:thioredoxin-related protein